jgi:hypothetical protein
LNRAVVFHRLRDKGFDPRDPVFVEGVGGKEFQGVFALRFLSHLPPETEGGMGIVSRQGHEDEADVVRLVFLGPAVRE